jgi:hypothetical protein
MRDRPAALPVPEIIGSCLLPPRMTDNLLPAQSPVRQSSMSVRPPGGTLEKGLAPRRLLGVAGSNQEVRLVQLTTEPGNPGGRDPPRFVHDDGPR